MRDQDVHMLAKQQTLRSSDVKPTRLNRPEDTPRTNTHMTEYLQIRINLLDIVYVRP